MAKFNDIIGLLLGQKIIIKRMPSGRLKSFDFNRIQAGASLLNVGAYKGAYLSNKHSYSSGKYNIFATAEIDSIRKQMYIDYDSMDADAIISAALDIYADESTVKNHRNELIKIETENEKIKSILYNLYYDILNINFNLWHWTRSLCKYGDLFLYIQSQPTFGVIDVVPIHASMIRRIDNYIEEKNGLIQTQYIYDGDINYAMNKTLLDFHEIAHFRLIGDTNFLPYGKSIIEGSRRTFKQLTMMEDAMLIQRIMRAPERRKYLIDIGNLPDEEVDAYMEKLINNTKKEPYIDPATGEYNLRFNLMNSIEDIYIPVRGGDTGTQIDTLSGLANDGYMDDIKYIEEKLFTQLKIPKAYLGKEAEGTGDSKGTLAAQDSRFANGIARIQEVLISELEKIGYIHLTYQGFAPEELGDFSLTMSSPSLINQRQQVDILNEKMNFVQANKEHRIFSDKWVYENVFNLAPDEWKAEEDNIIQDLKNEFRRQQIKDEGNDPQKTGESKGTPHDIASMHVASKLSQMNTSSSELKNLGAKDEREDNTGRPIKPGSWGRDRDVNFGRDPDGKKAFTGPINANNDVDRIYKSIEKDKNGKISLTELMKPD